MIPLSLQQLIVIRSDLANLVGKQPPEGTNKELDIFFRCIAEIARRACGNPFYDRILAQYICYKYENELKNSNDNASAFYKYQALVKFTKRFFKSLPPSCQTMFLEMPYTKINLKTGKTVQTTIGKELSVKNICPSFDPKIIKQFVKNLGNSENLERCFITSITVPYKNFFGTTTRQDIALEIMQTEWFSQEINLDILGEAFYYSIAGDWRELTEKICQHKKFAEISGGWLRKALEPALEIQDQEVIDAILNHKNFIDDFASADSSYLGRVLEKALKIKHRKTMDIIINITLKHENFAKIYDNKDDLAFAGGYLGRSLEKALEIQHQEVIDAVLNHENFIKFCGFALRITLSQALRSKNETVIQAILHHPNFSTILPEALEEAIVLSIIDNRLDLLIAALNPENKYANKVFARRYSYDFKLVIQKQYKQGIETVLNNSTIFFKFDTDVSSEHQPLKLIEAILNANIFHPFSKVLMYNCIKLAVEYGRFKLLGSFMKKIIFSWYFILIPLLFPVPLIYFFWGLWKNCFPRIRLSSNKLIFKCFHLRVSVTRKK